MHPTARHMVSPDVIKPAMGISGHVHSRLYLALAYCLWSCNSLINGGWCTRLIAQGEAPPLAMAWLVHCSFFALLMTHAYSNEIAGAEATTAQGSRHALRGQHAEESFDDAAAEAIASEEAGD